MYVCVSLSVFRKQNLKLKREIRDYISTQVILTLDNKLSPFSFQFSLTKILLKITDDKIELSVGKHLKHSKWTLNHEPIKNLVPLVIKPY